MHISYYIHVRNMRAHNINVRSFILRSATVTGREETGRRREKKIIIIKNKYPSHKCVHRRATGNKPLLGSPRLALRFLYIRTYLYIIYIIIYNDERNTRVDFCRVAGDPKRL